MLIDAFNDEYDTAIVISADSDLSGSISSVLKRFPTKRIITAFPPKRSSVELKSISFLQLSIFTQVHSEEVFYLLPLLNRMDLLLLAQLSGFTIIRVYRNKTTF